MRSIRYLSILLLSLLFGVGAFAQGDFNPTSPGDPGVPPQKLILVASPAEGGTVRGGGRYETGTSVKIVAAANANWSFVNWTDESGSEVSKNKEYTLVKQNKTETFTANFVFNPGSPADPVPAVVYYQLTLTAEPSEGGTVSGGGKYAEGISVPLSATSKSNYDFVEWVNEDGNVVSTSALFNYTKKGKNEKLTARFAFNPTSPEDPTGTHEVKVTTTEGGTLLCQGGRFKAGTVIEMYVIANTGYKFGGWYLDGELYQNLNKFNFTVPDRDVELNARFTFNPDSPGDPSMPEDKQFAIYLMSPISYPGRNTDFSVYLSNLSGLKDMSFNLTFPEGITPQMNNIELSEEMQTNGYSITSTASSGSTHTYSISILGGNTPSGNREIFRIPLIIPETIVPMGDYQIKINQVSLIKAEDNTPSAASTSNGRLLIYYKGDTNGDGTVNVTDVVNLIDFINFGTQDGVDFIQEVSNVNEDEQINVTDAVGIIEIINGTNE